VIDADWLRELRCRTAYYAQERVGDRTVRSRELAMEMLASGRVDLRPLITHRFPLTEWRQAVAVALDKRRHHAVKVLLQPA
jgi:threonine dehydrogenase-like Zn-dependent dehydrogenase